MPELIAMETPTTPWGIVGVIVLSMMAAIGLLWRHFEKNFNDLKNESKKCHELREVDAEERANLKVELATIRGVVEGNTQEREVFREEVRGIAELAAQAVVDSNENEE